MGSQYFKINFLHLLWVHSILLCSCWVYHKTEITTETTRDTVVVALHTCAGLETAGVDFNLACNSRTVLDSSAFLNTKHKLTWHIWNTHRNIQPPQKNNSAVVKKSPTRSNVLFNTFTSAVQSFASKFQSHLSLFACTLALSPITSA